jgi:hypothetical protein
MTDNPEEHLALALRDDVRDNRQSHLSEIEAGITALSPKVIDALRRLHVSTSELEARQRAFMAERRREVLRLFGEAAT